MQLGPGRPVGVVLAGGESRRMGRDKAVLAIDGETLAARAARKLGLATAQVVVADRGRGIVPGLTSLGDGEGRGPVAGILGAAATFPGQPLLVLACDLPLVPIELLAALAREPGFDWVVPESPRGLEPLCSLYGQGALAALVSRVRAGHFSLHDLDAQGSLAVLRYGVARLSSFGDPGRMFANLNEPGDLTALEAALGAALESGG